MSAALTPCIFQKKDHKFVREGSLIVVVEGCGQVGRGPRGGQRKALSTASGPPRAPPGHRALEVLPRGAAAARTHPAAADHDVDHGNRGGLRLRIAAPFLALLPQPVRLHAQRRAAIPGRATAGGWATPACQGGPGRRAAGHRPGHRRTRLIPLRVQWTRRTRGVGLLCPGVLRERSPWQSRC